MGTQPAQQRSKASGNNPASSEEAHTVQLRDYSKWSTALSGLKCLCTKGPGAIMGLQRVLQHMEPRCYLDCAPPFKCLFLLPILACMFEDTGCQAACKIITLSSNTPEASSQTHLQADAFKKYPPKQDGIFSSQVTATFPLKKEKIMTLDGDTKSRLQGDEAQNCNMDHHQQLI